MGINPYKDLRQYTPSTARNMPVILDAFKRLMPCAGNILEVACGSGQHGAAISHACPEVRWHPTDISPDSRASADAWRIFYDLPNMAQAQRLDVTANTTAENTPETQYNGLICLNMIHIAPIAAVAGLFAVARAQLLQGACLFLYGPFSRNGGMVPSNHAFDRWLKERDPEWGVRDLEKCVIPIAAQEGFTLDTVENAPANNLIVLFKKQPADL